MRGFSIIVLAILFLAGPSAGQDAVGVTSVFTDYLNAGWVITWGISACA